MITLHNISDIQTQLHEVRFKKSIALVPTMGFLHEGHLSLIRNAKSENDIVVTSIFVNPTQFAPHEDLDKYPRDIQRDTQFAESAGTDILFVPSSDEMYPSGFSSSVVVEGLSSVLEGKFRPTHFKGVTTVVLKLFNIVQPQSAYFGQKDAQQSIIIKKMVNDLNFQTNIQIIPTKREADGLAMSSRNVYLNPEQRKDAVVLSNALRYCEKKITDGERNAKKIIEEMETMIKAKHPSQIDYIEIVDAETLEQKTDLRNGDHILVPLAVRFGTTRLIDNILLTV